MELLLAIDECMEWLEYLTCQAWEYLVQHKLWKAGFMTLEEVKEQINWPVVSERIARHQQTQKCKGYDSEGINFEGPAPRPMDRAHVEIDPEGQIVVDTNRLFRWPKGDRNEFEDKDRGAYLSV